MALVLLLTPLALVGAAIARWTRWHPLLIALALGLLPGAFGALAMAGFLADGSAVLMFGAFAFVSGGGIAGLGAFLGWLRRKHLEKVA